MKIAINLETLRKLGPIDQTIIGQNYRYFGINQVGNEIVLHIDDAVVLKLVELSRDLCESVAILAGILGEEGEGK